MNFTDIKGYKLLIHNINSETQKHHKFKDVGSCDQKSLSFFLKYFLLSTHISKPKFKTKFWGLYATFGATVYII